MATMIPLSLRQYQEKLKAKATKWVLMLVWE